MQVALKVMGAALGLIVPALFISVLLGGVRRSPLTPGAKARFRSGIIGVVIVWLLCAWTASLTGSISHHGGDVLPRWLVGLALPSAIGLLALSSKSFRTIVESVPLQTLVGVQAFRLAGLAFLLVVSLGILPGAFVSGGYGDLATGMLAIVTAMLLVSSSPVARPAFWAFTIIGLGDLLNVAYMLLRYDPIWYQGTPSSAAAATFSLVMIPVVAAPLALILHVYAVMRALRG
jgi:hypothetical protein